MTPSSFDMDPFSKTNTPLESQESLLSFRTALRSNRCVFKDLPPFHENRSDFSQDLQRHPDYAYEHDFSTWDTHICNTLTFHCATLLTRSSFDMDPFSESNTPLESHESLLSFRTALKSNRCVFKDLCSFHENRSDFWQDTQRHPDYAYEHDFSTWDTHICNTLTFHYTTLLTRSSFDMDPFSKTNTPLESQESLLSFRIALRSNRCVFKDLHSFHENRSDFSQQAQRHPDYAHEHYFCT